MDEIGAKGQELYHRAIRSQVEPAHNGKFLVLDVETGRYAIEADDLTATRRMLEESHGERLYGLRIGYPTAYRLGGRSIQSAEP